MISRNIWNNAKTEKPKLARTVFDDGAIRLQESEPVFLRLEFENGLTDYVTAVYREMTGIKDGHRHTIDAYFETIDDETIYEHDANDISAWMYAPRPDAINADWLIEQMNGDCDYCEHLTNLRDNSPCMNCIHAPVGSILPDETTKNHWTITKTYRPSIEERTVYPG